MAILLSDVTNALQKVIMPYIQDNYDKESVLLNQIKRNQGVTFMNDTFYAPIRTSRHGGIANLANDGNSLPSGKSSIGQASVTTKILTGTFDISKLTLDATSTSKGAVENQLTFQARTLASDFAKNVNRQYYSDGVGVVTQVAGSVSSTSFSVKTPNSSLDDTRSIDWYGTVNGDINPTKYIQPGQVIGIGTAGAVIGTVSSKSGNTITVTGATASVADDAIYIMDATATVGGAGTTEIQGMRAALSSSTGASTYAGVARSVDGWTPQIGTASEALTLSAIEDVYLSALEFSQMGDRFAIFMNRSLFKKYGDILTAMRRSVDKVDLIGGFKGLEFVAGRGTVGVFLDFDVPDGEVLVVNLDSWTVCQVSDMSWLEDQGALIRRPDKITYQATMVWFTNLLCLAPAANGRLTQKTD